MWNVICFCLLLLCSAVPAVAGEGSGTITGKWITKAHGPMSGGQVLLFNAAVGPAPAGNRFLRIPDAGAAIDEQGKFTLEVPAGSYYLVMRKRVDAVSAGPPEEGDPQYYARTKKGKPKLLVIRVGRVTNIGTITEAVPYRKEKTVPREGMTGIEGTVRDAQGIPVAGVRVLAYGTPEMLGRPLYASDKTGEDGRYFLSVTRQENYYLKARTHYGGGKPVEGELMGYYGGRISPVLVAVEQGKISKGIDISVERFSSKKGK